MIAHEIKTASKADEAAILDVLTLSFGSDPFWRWVYEDPTTYLRFFPELARILAGNAFNNASGYYLDRLLGAALWLPPRVTFDADALNIFLQRTVPMELHGDLFALSEQVLGCHPQDPHWYLVVIGVDPACQNQGQGSALVEYGLRACDRDHLPAYLESSNRRNITFYKKHGFEVLTTLQAGKSPPVFALLRTAR
jgi:ribosomal protein S18 acetylase RimI-like enzyme